MRLPDLALALVLAAGTAPAIAQAPSSSAALTLAEAMRLAETTHPNVRAREAQLAAAEGIRREASVLFFNNPELSTERATPRRCARRNIDRLGYRHRPAVRDRWTTGASA